jgi:ribonuclease D
VSEPAPLDDATPEQAEPEDTAIALTHPAEGVPEVTASAAQLISAIELLASGHGPVAIDAERASGYRYGQRAYLVQLRRRGAGTVLIDPVPLPDLASLQQAIGSEEWVLHAASQDLPCLAELGLAPSARFDTELAGRLTGHARVGLGPLTEEMLGYRLEKGHSAADWSTRPLPEPWLVYAALDVELLVDLRDALEAELAETGRTEWARQEFAALVAAGTPAARTDPWRRTSGIHKLRSRRHLAVVRALWEVRDQLARSRDIAPGRLVPDSSIIAAASAQTPGDLTQLPGFGGRFVRQYAPRFTRARDAALALPDDELPPTSLPGDGPPPAHRWADRDPVAALRLAAARAVMADLADTTGVAVEVLLSPDALRRTLWALDEQPSADVLAARLTALGARPWQIALTVDKIAAAMP